MMISCPVCHERHRVNDNYDNQDIICSNTSNRRSQKIFQDLTPTDILSRSGFMMNRSSTKEDAGRPVTVDIKGPDFRPTAERIGKLQKNY